jgi:hypothetical protein
MSMQSVGGISGFDPTKMAETLFTKLDANKDGSIDKSEFLSSMSKMHGGSQRVEKLFSKIDSNGDGKIDATENLDALKKMAAHEHRPAGQMHGPAPEGGGASKGGEAKGASGAGGSSSSSQVYDPRDTNKDGVVSLEEEIAYSLTQIQKNSGGQKQADIAKLASRINNYQNSSSSSSSIGVDNQFNISA